MLKVQPHVEGLCASCDHAATRETLTGRLFVHCHEFSEEISEPIARCTAYLKKGTPDRYEFEKIAWVLNTEDRKGVRIVGFAPPKREKGR
jgi:hypothetical protein